MTDRWTDGRTDRHCMTEKTALASHRAVKTMTIMLNRFHLIPECHGRTDGQTDRQTGRQADGRMEIAISISRQCADDAQ